MRVNVCVCVHLHTAKYYSINIVALRIITAFLLFAERPASWLFINAYKKSAALLHWTHYTSWLCYACNPTTEFDNIDPSGGTRIIGMRKMVLLWKVSRNFVNYNHSYKHMFWINFRIKPTDNAFDCNWKISSREKKKTVSDIV